MQKVQEFVPKKFHTRFSGKVANFLQKTKGITPKSSKRVQLDAKNVKSMQKVVEIARKNRKICYLIKMNDKLCVL